MRRVVEELQQRLADADFKSAVVSTRHLAELRRDFEKLLEDKSLNREFYDEIVSRYGLYWNFDPPEGLPEAKSLIVTATLQPKVSLEFLHSGKGYYAIIPPTYIYDTDQRAADTISRHLGEHGYEICNALVPTKLVAVRSGLAKYGRNNITYIDGWGSYHRLRAFFSDMPCDDDCWQEPAAMELCDTCTTCIKKCPTKAIQQDRFLVDAGKCLTFFNEKDGEFPIWLDAKWHNALIGCMICQDVCPANKERTAWIMPGGEFSEEETEMILNGVSKDRLPTHTAEKLKKVCMFEEYDLLQRNLRVLINKQERAQK